MPDYGFPHDSDDTAEASPGSGGSVNLRLPVRQLDSSGFSVIPNSRTQNRCFISLIQLPVLYAVVLVGWHKPAAHPPFCKLVDALEAYTTLPGNTGIRETVSRQSIKFCRGNHLFDPKAQRPALIDVVQICDAVTDLMSHHPQFYARYCSPVRSGRSTVSCVDECFV